MGQFDTVEQLEESTTSLVSSSTSAYSYFPVDVVVYVRVQVPSLDLIVYFLQSTFTQKPATSNNNNSIQSFINFIIHVVLLMDYGSIQR